MPRCAVPWPGLAAAPLDLAVDCAEQVVKVLDCCCNERIDVSHHRRCAQTSTLHFPNMWAGAKAKGIKELAQGRSSS